MREDLFSTIIPGVGNPIDPAAMARRDLQKNLPKRFWSAVGIGEGEHGFSILLDGRPARTPAKAALALPTRAAAERVAAEWRALTDLVDPARMPLTRLANSAIDGVAREMDAVAADIVNYAGSDLLCYRAGDPVRLVSLQALRWDPILDWAHEDLGANFIMAEGVMFARQPEPAIEAVHRAVALHKDAHGLAALHSMTSLMGSAILALAVARGRLSPTEAWSLAHLDEDFQMEVWGRDDEALIRRDTRWRDMAAAADLLAAVTVP
jgi:chaperone required for assembly of F1-ATPase